MSDEIGDSRIIKPQPAQPMYACWLNGRLRDLLDEAEALKHQAPADQSAAVHAALKQIDDVLVKLQPHAK